MITLFFSLVVFSSVLAVRNSSLSDGISWYAMVFIMIIFAVPITISTLLVNEKFAEFIRSIMGFGLFILIGVSFVLMLTGNGLISLIAGHAEQGGAIHLKDLLAPFYYIYFSLGRAAGFSNLFEFAGSLCYVLAISAVSYRIYVKMDKQFDLEEFEPFALFRSLIGAGLFSYFLSPLLPQSPWLATLIIFAVIAGSFTVLTITAKSYPVKS